MHLLFHDDGKCMAFFPCIFQNGNGPGSDYTGKKAAGFAYDFFVIDDFFLRENTESCNPEFTDQVDFTAFSCTVKIEDRFIIYDLISKR